MAAQLRCEIPELQSKVPYSVSLMDIGVYVCELSLRSGVCAASILFL